MNILEKMIKRQEEVNIVAMGENWYKLGLDWRLAISQEAAELIDSFDWKWWSKCSSPASSRIREKLLYRNGKLFYRSSMDEVATHKNYMTGYMTVKDEKLIEYIYENKKKEETLHSLIYMYHYGDIPDRLNFVIDHIDKDICNNSIENLRLIDRSSNARNSSIFEDANGFYYHKSSNRYISQIRMNGKKVYIGSFNTEDDARKAYLEFIKENDELLSPSINSGMGFKNCIDIDNAKIEIVDIWHFVLSIMKEEGIDIDNLLCDRFSALTRTGAVSLPAESKEVIKYCKNITRVAANDKSAMEIADAVLMAAGKIGMSFEEITKLYMGKAVLNIFRQRNGYNNGSYVKIWNGSEDNEVMMDIVAVTPLDENFEDSVDEKLTEMYMMVS